MPSLDVTQSNRNSYFSCVQCHSNHDSIETPIKKECSFFIQNVCIMMKC